MIFQVVEGSPTCIPEWRQWEAETPDDPRWIMAQVRSLLFSATEIWGILLTQHKCTHPNWYGDCISKMTAMPIGLFLSSFFFLYKAQNVYSHKFMAITKKGERYLILFYIQFARGLLRFSNWKLNVLLSFTLILNLVDLGKFCEHYHLNILTQRM